MQTTATRGEGHSIKSMTGFGRGRRIADGVEVVTEVRSVNHRFLDISVRVPRIYSSFDPQIRQRLSERIHRGKLEVAVSRSGSTGTIADVGLDLHLAERYHELLVELKERLGLAGEVSLSDMLTLKEIVSPVEMEEIEREQPLVEESLDEALVAHGRESILSTGDPTAHAVIIAVREAATRLGRRSLAGMTVFSVVEPCAMCIGALQQADGRFVHGRSVRLLALKAFFKILQGSCCRPVCLSFFLKHFNPLFQFFMGILLTHDDLSLLHDQSVLRKLFHAYVIDGNRWNC